MSLSRWITTLILLAGTTANSWASPQKMLQARLKQAQQFSAEFEQSILNERGQLTHKSQGHLYLQKPKKIRWEITSLDEPRLLVSDGHKIWDYDKELAQVVVRDFVSEELPLPLMLLSGQDIGQIAHFYLIEHQVMQAPSMDCFNLTPKANDSFGDFQRIKLCYHKHLYSIEILDQLDQTTHLKFTNVQEPKTMPARLFRFKIPTHVDVIRG